MYSVFSLHILSLSGYDNIHFLNSNFFLSATIFYKKISTSCNNELFRFYDNRTNSRFSCLVICTNCLVDLTVLPIVYAYFIFLFKDIFLLTLLLFYNVFSTNIHIHILVHIRLTDLGLIGYLLDRTSWLKLSRAS